MSDRPGRRHRQAGERLLAVSADGTRPLPVPSPEASSFLADLQEATYSSLGIPPPDYDRIHDGPLADSLLRLVYPDEAVRRAARDEWDHLLELRPTPYEEPIIYRELLLCAARTETVIAEFGTPLTARPALGTLATGRINAVTAAVPDSDEYVVLFDADLFVYLLLMCKVVAHAMPLVLDEEGPTAYRTNLPDVAAHLAANPSLVDRFTEAVQTYRQTGRVMTTSPWATDPRYVHLTSLLLDCVTSFVVAHEYAHMVLGHLATTDRVHGVVAMPEVEALDYSWRQELRADELGTYYTVRGLETGGMGLDQAFWGPDLFFSFVAVLESVVPPRPGASHPPARMRQERVRAAIRDALDEAVAEGVIGSAARLDAIVGELRRRADLGALPGNP